MKNEHKHDKLIIGIVVGVLVVGLFFGLMAFLNIGPFAKTQATTISGSFDINGNIPEGSTIKILAKEYNSSDPLAEVRSDIPAVDGGTFEFTDLKEGTTYVGQAQVVDATGKKVGESQALTVTAPASNEIIVINIESEGTANAVISGNVQIHGYIPANSTITIEGREAGTSTYNIVNEGIPAKSRQFMSYNSAIEGTSYEVVGFLVDSTGTRIGSSPVLVVTAPAANETLTINSQAVAPSPTPAPEGQPTPTPAPKTVISGSIDLNGVAPSSSRIVILQRPANSTSDFQVAQDNINPVNGATWQWNGAKSSSWYEIVAVLKQRQQNGTDRDIAQSSYQTVAAPANNVSLSINTGISLSAPSGQVSLTCGSQSGDQWNATLTIPNVPGAQSYWYQVGTTQGGSNVQNATVNASGGNDAKVSISLGNQQTVFMRYAFANVANLGTGNSQFSPFSSSSQGACGF